MQKGNLIENFFFIVVAQFQKSGLNVAELFDQRLIHGGESFFSLLEPLFKLEFILGRQPLFPFIPKTSADIREGKSVFIHVLVERAFYYR
ncbi:hypothetical protein D3C80_1587420 [compost metagenome]